MLFVYHHNDMDGFGSAALLRQAFAEEDVRLVCCDYSVPLNNALAEIHPTDSIYIVDYSFSESTVDELFDLISIVGEQRITWIDHHLSSVKIVNSFPKLKRLQGVLDLRYSGMALTWMFLNKLPICATSYDRCPLAVRFVSDYDTWTKSLPESDYFRMGMDALDLSVDSNIWKRILLDEDYVQSLIENGKTINGYLRNYYAHKLNRYGFVTRFAGYECLAINQKDNSDIFGDNRQRYPLCVIFQTNGKRWFYTVYSSDPEIDCSLIAAVFGGGGHKGAAGFSTDQLLNAFKCECNE